jgi:hypothetical protein
MEANEHDIIYETLMQKTKLLIDGNGNEHIIPVLNRSMSCHIHGVNTKDELINKLNSIYFITHVDSRDANRWIVVCKVTDVKNKNIFSELRLFSGENKAAYILSAIQFMKEGVHELLTNVSKVSLVHHERVEVLLDNDIEQHFGINIEERLNEGEYYTLFEILLN